MNEKKVNEKSYKILKLLGKGKGGYSYLACSNNKCVVVKQIHHEPCGYYTFGNKIEAELYDYKRLLNAGIRMPVLIDVNKEQEIIVKEYIEGDTIFELVKRGESVDEYIKQVRQMAALAKKAGLNIDYYPTNFVVQNNLIYYIDYECNEYSEKWNFDNWGIKYWSRTKEFEEALQKENH